METIGRLEAVDIEALELFGLDAKIDTGAYSCALHCDNIRVEGEEVTFNLHDEVHPAYNGKEVTMPIHKRSRVKSSNGRVEERIVIKTPLKMGARSYMASISLTNRKKMRYPLLIGRKFLTKRFVVDVSLQYTTKEA